MNNLYNIQIQWFTRSFLRNRLSRVRLLVLDVDGVLTDGSLWTDEQGFVIKRFDVRDGLGIRMLQQAGIEVAILSGGKSGATEQRACYLGIKNCFTSVKNKHKALLDLQNKLSFGKEDTAYIGDDLNDLVVRPLVSLLISPADGAKVLKKKCDWILQQNGGDGVIRFVAEAILDAQGHWEKVASQGWLDQNE